MDFKYTNKQLSNEAYHADKTHISSSVIKKIIKNPYSFHLPQELTSSKAMIVGSIVHSMVLEPETFEEEYILEPVWQKKTKMQPSTIVEQKLAFKQKHSGKTVISIEDYNQAITIAENIKLIMEDREICSGEAESSFFSEIDGVKVKCRADLFDPAMGILSDIKTTSFHPSPESFSKEILKYGYHISAALYIDIFDSLGIDVFKYVFVVGQSVYPFATATYELDEQAIEKGREEYKKGLEYYNNIDRYKEPFVVNEDGEKIPMISIPAYALSGSEEVKLIIDGKEVII